MAAEPQDTDDLSMEKILESIREIISDDDDKADHPPSQQAEADMTDDDINDAQGSDVLELTDIVQEDEDEAAPASSEAPAESIDVLKEIDDAMEEDDSMAADEEDSLDEFAAAPVPAKQKDAAPKEKKEVPLKVTAKAEQTKPDRLLSDNAKAASAASLKKIIDTQKATSPSPAFRSGETVENLVLECLKPMLKDWLDTNLPGMVERIVEREIRKLVD